MEPKHAKKLAVYLIKLYLGSAWKFKWSESNKWYGYCDYDQKTIRLSKPLVKEETRAHVQDTILHEIAHALAPYEADNDRLDKFHGDNWMRIAEKIGAIPTNIKYSSKDHADWRQLCGGQDPSVSPIL